MRKQIIYLLPARGKWRGRGMEKAFVYFFMGKEKWNLLLLANGLSRFVCFNVICGSAFHCFFFSADELHSCLRTSHGCDGSDGSHHWSLTRGKITARTADKSFGRAKRTSPLLQNILFSNRIQHLSVYSLEKLLQSKTLCPHSIIPAMVVFCYSQL